jgi:hypothetical protein
VCLQLTYEPHGPVSRTFSACYQQSAPLNVFRLLPSVMFMSPRPVNGKTRIRPSASYLPVKFREGKRSLQSTRSVSKLTLKQKAFMNGRTGVRAASVTVLVQSVKCMLLSVLTQLFIYCARQLHISATELRRHHADYKHKMEIFTVAWFDMSLGEFHRVS